MTRPPRLWPIKMIGLLRSYHRVSWCSGNERPTHLIFLSFDNQIAQQLPRDILDTYQVIRNALGHIGVVSEDHDSRVFNVASELPRPEKLGLMGPSLLGVAIETMENDDAE